MDLLLEQIIELQHRVAHRMRHEDRPGRIRDERIAFQLVLLDEQPRTLCGYRWRPFTIPCGASRDQRVSRRRATAEALPARPGRSHSESQAHDRANLAPPGPIPQAPRTPMREAHRGGGPGWRYR